MKIKEGVHCVTFYKKKQIFQRSIQGFTVIVFEDGNFFNRIREIIFSEGIYTQIYFSIEIKIKIKYKEI